MERRPACGCGDPGNHQSSGSPAERPPGRGRAPSTGQASPLRESGERRSHPASETPWVPEKVKCKRWFRLGFHLTSSKELHFEAARERLDLVKILGMKKTSACVHLNFVTTIIRLHFLSAHCAFPLPSPLPNFTLFILRLQSVFLHDGRELLHQQGVDLSVAFYNLILKQLPLNPAWK